MDDGQGWHRLGVARGGDRRAFGARSRRTLPRLWPSSSGDPISDRIEAPATAEQKKRLSGLSPEQVRCTHLAGEPVQSILSHAPGNDAPIGGVKVIAAGGWFAARPSGTEDLYRIYAESFRGEKHLHRIMEEAQAIVDVALRVTLLDGETG